MAITCWAHDCGHNNKKNECKFYRFPKDKKVLKTWITLLRRDIEPGSGARVCSCHFREGNKENLPELFDHNKRKLFGEHYLSPERKKSRNKSIPFSELSPSTSTTTEVLANKPIDDGPSVSITEPNLSSTMEQSSSSVVEPSTSVTEASTSVTEASTSDTEPSSSSVDKSALSKPSMAMLEAENYLLKLELNRRDLESLRQQMSFSQICESDKLILEYTGLPSKNIFLSLNKLIENVDINYYLKWRFEKLSRMDQLLVVLMKFRHNYSHTDLAFRFKVSEATITNIVVTFTHILYEALYETFLKQIPRRSKNKSCLPNCASSFTNCRIMIDCTDIFCAVPRKSMKSQRLTYSSYKHRNSFKGLVGVAPNGVVTFISNLYPGSTSDKNIVRHCKILEQMEPGDLILADKGFLIQDLLPSGVTLNIPPFLATPQFSKEEIERTKCIARARIHVERAIRRMKSYKILNFIPEPLFNYSSVIFKTVGALTNLQYPLIKEVSQFYIDSNTSTPQNE